MLKYHRKCWFSKISALTRNGTTPPPPPPRFWMKEQFSHPGLHLSEVPFTQEPARVWALSGCKWPRGSSSAWPWVPPCLRPGTGTLLGHRRKKWGEILPAETLAWAPVRQLQQPRRVPWRHREADFGYWGPVTPWCARGKVRGDCPGNVAASSGYAGAPPLVCCSQARASFCKTDCDSWFFCPRVLILWAMADLEANFLTLASSLASGPFFRSQQTSVLSRCKSIIASLTGLPSGPAVQIHWWRGSGSVRQIPAGSSGSADASCSCPAASQARWGSSACWGALPPLHKAPQIAPHFIPPKTNVCRVMQCACRGII